MAIQLGSAYAKIVIDSSGVTVGVGNAIKHLGSLQEVGLKVGESMQNVGRSMTIGLTLPLLAVGAASIKMASDYEEAKNKALVVFGEMSDGVVKNADKAAQSLGVNKKAYLDYASTVGAALTSGGMSITDATALSEQAVKHFADLMSFHNTSIEDASMAWQSAIRGQFEPIQKYFPFITDSFLKTYGTANGMLDANTKTLTANQRAIILNAIALDEKLNPALNDFAETSGGLANSTRSMKEELNNALITLGTNFLPLALALVQGLNRLLTSFNGMSPAMQKVVIGFGMILAAMGPIIFVIGKIVSLISLISSIAPMVSGLGISFAGIGSAASAAGAAVMAAGASIAAIALPILLIIGTLALLYLAFKNNWFGITDTVKQAWFLIGYYINQMVVKIRDLFSKIDWRSFGKYMMQGLATGMLGGIPMIVSAAIKAGQMALAAIRKALGISSPSKEFMKLGVFSGQGFSAGLANAMDPNEIARTMAKPVHSMNNSTSTNNTINLSGGLTLRDVDALMSEKINRFAGRLDKALGA